MRENHNAILVCNCEIPYVYRVIVAYENKNQRNINKYALLQLFMLIYESHLFSSFVVVWFLFGAFLFLVCALIQIIISIFAA